MKKARGYEKLAQNHKPSKEELNTKRNPQALPVVRQCVLHGQ